MYECMDTRADSTGGSFFLKQKKKLVCPVCWQKDPKPTAVLHCCLCLEASVACNTPLRDASCVRGGWRGG